MLGERHRRADRTRPPDGRERTRRAFEVLSIERVTPRPPPAPRPWNRRHPSVLWPQACPRTKRTPAKIKTTLIKRQWITVNDLGLMGLYRRAYQCV